jgi:hypothetical protein
MKLLTALAAALLTAPAAGAQYATDYFRATPAGSWARHEVRTASEKGKTSVSRQTVSRLADVDGNLVIETRSEPVEGEKGKAFTVQVHVAPAVLEVKNPLAFAGHVRRMILQQDGEKAREFAPEMLQQMTGGAMQLFDYSSNVKDLGAETVDGRATEHYQASGEVELKVIVKTLRYAYTSDQWLSAEVPFGRVKENTVTRDDQGRTRSTIKMVLLASGADGAKSHLSGEIEKVEMPGLPFGR